MSGSPATLAITLTPAARQWILERGGAATIRHSPRHGCCGGQAMVPVADAFVPADAAGYERATIDGVEVHWAHSLGTGGRVIIDLAGFWRWRRLIVTGAGFGAVGPGATRSEGV